MRMSSHGNLVTLMRKSEADHDLDQSDLAFAASLRRVLIAAIRAEHGPARDRMSLSHRGRTHHATTT